VLKIGKDFAKEEFDAAQRLGIELISRGYLGSWNFIFSEDELPQGRVVVHYQQEYRSQIKFIRNKMKERFSCQAADLPRYTFYALDPKYVTKRSFKRDYRNATFWDRDLNEFSIDEIVIEPEGKFVQRNERDLVFDISGRNSAAAIARYLYRMDKEGPMPWMDAAIIILPKETVGKIPHFVPKNFFSISKPRSEFYSVIFDRRRKGALQRDTKRFGDIPNLVRFLDSMVNEELVDYMRRTMAPFRPF